MKVIPKNKVEHFEQLDILDRSFFFKKVDKNQTSAFAQTPESKNVCPGCLGDRVTR
jgi:hypothetical protein